MFAKWAELHRSFSNPPDALRHENTPIARKSAGHGCGARGLLDACAQRTGFPPDKLYETEEREGGTRAVGCDVPGIDRAKLNIFMREEWETPKRETMFDTWVAAARNATPGK
jgi:hypothetical protein